MAEPSRSGPSRRAILKAGAAAAAGALFFPAVVRGGWKGVVNVIIARFGGGVRFQETFGSPTLAHVPKLGQGGNSLAGQGTLFTHVYNDGDTSHMGATQQLLTGKWFDPAKSPAQTCKEPTIFEFLRQNQGRKAGPTKCLVLDHSTVDFSYNHSVSGQFGKEFGGYQFQPRLITFHHLTEVIQSEQDQNNSVCQQARALQDQILTKEDYENIEDPTRLPPVPDATAKDFLQRIFARDRVPRVATGDELVLHFALAAMDDNAWKPRILLLNFAGPDVAHRGSYTAYVNQIRALDTVVDALRNAILRNSHYAKTTLLIVTPDCGRSLDGQGRGGFADHQGGDAGCRHTWALFWGGPVPKGRRVSRPCAQIDLAATIGEAMDFGMPGVDGKALAESR